MLQNVTEEQMNLINNVFNNHGDEYRTWAGEHGKPHLKEWYEEHGESKGLFNAEFAYYIVSKFIEWKNSNVEGAE